ncbi:Molybdenum cofactor biosynthesis protein B [Bacillus sp. T2.9-1]|uniref:MogA/MoaB family molybdenum cofactor biosynthesis protein n=1 Tax=Bacillus sp. T2.9-1 TaxID=3041163 RepID=UPI00247746F8|nr:molybdenum cofactor biosynthesis protein B [Bacillus sp. T2.9-1]CAI9393795.1 Molybdenum cofactor biosynthesis protein B [Bacillus sp. T2.9-1]
MNKQTHINNHYWQVGCKVITVSDTRTIETDKSGKLMIELLEQDNHSIEDYIIINDDKQRIQQEIVKGLQSGKIDCILLNGGTGISPRDVTIEAIKPLLTKELYGFGELFRMLSYTEDIGSSAILSRAIAGTIHNKVVFSTPGSTGAVRLAMKKLVLPELSHVVSELHK